MTEQPQNQTTTLLGLDVDSDTMFSNHKGTYKSGIQKRQCKLLEKITFLQPFLQPREKILLVTTGCSPVSVAEQMLTGWIVFQLKRALFVFTDRRIFHIPTKPDFTYRNSIAQIAYGDCQTLKVKGSCLVAAYKSGKTEKFVYISSRERKKIKSLLQSIALEDAPQINQHRTHLCPRCTNPLSRDYYSCRTCGLEFKTKADARKISVIYPGGGYFYTRHPWLGMVDAVVELWLMTLLVTTFFAAISGEPGSLSSLIVIALILAFEKLLTVYHSNHFVDEYIPQDKLVVCKPQYVPCEKVLKSDEKEKSAAESCAYLRA